MRNKLSKIVLAAAFGLALAFTFSCSGDGGGDTPVWSDWIVTTPATCAAAGVETRTNDISETETRPIAQLQYDNTKLLCDARDGNLYKFVAIGTRTKIWMAQNLNYAVGGKCYGEGDKVITGWDNDFNPITTTLSEAEIQANCTTYGRLYNWETAMAGSGICPDGWHLPSNAEWNALMKAANPACIDNSDCVQAGTKLKAENGWYDYNEHGLGEPTGNGTDEFGFFALPGGYHTSTDWVGFTRVGSHGYWWSASEKDASHAYYLSMASDDKEYASYGSGDKSRLHSVRCVMD